MLDTASFLSGSWKTQFPGENYWFPLFRWCSRTGCCEPSRTKDSTFSTDVNVVNVFATVRDKKGQIVRNLTKDDFTLAEDDRPQTIRYFSQESGLPLTLGLLVDTSMSQRRVLGKERDASYRFLDQVLREDRDKAFLIHFDREVELLQDLTSSRKKLEAALDQWCRPARIANPEADTAVVAAMEVVGMEGAGAEVEAITAVEHLCMIRCSWRPTS